MESVDLHRGRTQDPAGELEAEPDHFSDVHVAVGEIRLDGLPHFVPFGVDRLGDHGLDRLDVVAPKDLEHLLLEHQDDLDPRWSDSLSAALARSCSVTDRMSSNSVTTPLMSGS